MNVSHSSIRGALRYMLVLILATGLLGAQTALAADNVSITVDSGGPDDVPAQTDVSLLGFDDSHLPDYFVAQMQFDDTAYPGGNSGDGCIFFDSDDAGGFSDFAVCGSFIQNTTTMVVELQSAALYDCKGSEPANDEGKRCGFIGGGGDGSNGIIAQDLDGDGVFESDGNGDPLATPYDTTCSLITTASDPFNGVGTHNTSGEQDPITDTQLSCTIFADELVELDGDVPTGIVVSNACSFTSPDPSSESKDCVVDAGSGFLQIVKNTTGGDTTFDYTLDGAAFASITTVGGTGSTDILTVDGNATFNLAEVVPTGWQLDSATCDNGDDPSSLTVGAAITVVCTFNNSLAAVPELAFDKRFVDFTDADGSGDISAGDTLNYAFDVSSVGTTPADLHNVIVTDDTVGTVTCLPGNPIPILLAGETETCTASYVVTAADVLAGEVVNIATADSDETDPPLTDTETVPVPSPSHTTDKALTANDDLDGSGDVSAGDTLTYTITVLNNGTANLTNVTVDDDLTGTVDALCSAKLLPGESCSVDVTYLVTPADVTAGVINNTGTGDTDQTDPNTDPETVPVPSPSHTTDKALTANDDLDGSGDVSAGDTLTYTITVLNNGTANLTNVTVDDDLTGTVDALCSAKLLPGESCSVDVTYLVTPADVTAGVINNTGTGDTDQTDPNTDPETVPVPSPSHTTDKALTANDDLDGSGDVSAGDTLTYTITVLNNGTANLTNVTVDDDLTGTVDALCSAKLLPGESCSVDVTYLVTPADVTAGVINNTGTGDTDQTDPNTDPETVPVPSPSHTTDKALTANDDLDGSGDVSAGDTLTYTITVLNNGTANLTNVTVDDDLTGTVDALCSAKLLPGESCSVDVTYLVTPADVTAGVINNTGTGDTDQTDPNTDPETVPVPSPSHTTDKALTANDDLDGSGDVSAGDTLTYTITVLNNGTANLTNVTVDDDLTGTVDALCSAKLLPGESCSVDVTYLVTPADVTAGVINNTGTGDTDQTDPNTDPETVPVPSPSHTTDKALTANDDLDGSGDVSAGDTLTYTITVLNNGTANLTNVTVDDDLTGTVDALCSAKLLPGESCSVDVTYLVTPADVTAGVINNTGTGDTDQTDPNTDPETVPVPSPSHTTDKALTANDDLDGSGDVSAGDTLTYTITVLNNGTANLTNVTVDDDLTGTVDALCSAKLLPGESCSVDVTYLVTPADVTAGVINNTGTGDTDQTDPNTDPETVPVPTPSLETVKDLFANADEDGSLDVSEGDTLTYRITVLNTGTANLTGVTVDDDLTGTVDALCAAFLAPTASCFVDVDYVVTADDVTAGQIDNIGTGDSVQTPPDSDPENVPVPTPSFDVDKQVVSITNPDLSDGGSEVDEAGDKITYDIVVTNDGTANLTNVTVDDDLTGTVDALCVAFLAPTESCTVTVMYTATQVDLDNNGTNPTLNGFIDNTATADSVQTDPVDDSEQVPVVQSPAHELDKTFDPNEVGVGEIGTFTLLYTNTGNVTLNDIDITDVVDPRLVVELVETSVGSCSDSDSDVQTVLCEVDSLAPGNSVTVTVTFTALAEDLVPDGTGVTSGANYVFYFANGYVLYGSTETGETMLLDGDRNPVPAEEWSVDGRNQDIFFTVPYAGGISGDGGFQLHLSCSEAFIDGWGSTGPIEGEDDPDWNILAYTVERYNSQGFLKDCTQTFPFDVDNTASAKADPAGGILSPNPIMDSDSVHVINIAPIEVTRDRVRRGNVEIQYFNTSFEDLVIEIIRVEWTEVGVLLESASYKDGVDLGISGVSPAEASISTIMPDRSKDWLRLSFDIEDAPDGLTVTIVTDTGATFTYVYGS